MSEMKHKMKILFVLCSYAWVTDSSWFNSEPEKEYSPIILIPGDGGNQLEAKLNKPADQTGCPLVKDWHRLWLDVWSLRGERLRCWSDNIKLIYNYKTKKSTNVQGVLTRVPGFGDTSSIEYLDPSWSAWVLADAGNYMKTMVDYFADIGYVRGESIRAAPYDFRFAPQSQERYFEMLKVLIERTSENNGNKPVTLISHSMGGLFGLHFLQRQQPTWLATYIHSFIPISCPWIGAVIQLNTYASGYNLGISIVDPKVIREEQRSYETGVYILPHQDLWTPENEVLVTTPSRNYTVRDYGQFFNDINFQQGMDMLNNVKNITRISHPGVRTHNIYSTGVDTPQGLRYDNGFPDEQPIKRIMGDGDGTVTHKSLTYIQRFLRPDAGDSQYYFSGLNHGDILKKKPVFQYIQSLVQLN